MAGPGRWYVIAAGVLAVGAALVMGLSSAALVAQAPRFAGWALVAAEELLAGPALVRLSPAPEGAGTEAGGSTDRGPGTDPLGAAARHTPVGTLVVDADPGTPPVGGRRSATVCRGTVCDLPTTVPEELPGRG